MSLAAILLTAAAACVRSLAVCLFVLRTRTLHVPTADESWRTSGEEETGEGKFEPKKTKETFLALSFSSL